MSTARPAVTVLGKDFTFPNRIDGMPEKLSDFADLKIGFFDTTRRRQTRLLGGRFRRATGLHARLGRPRRGLPRRAVSAQQALPRVRARPAQPGTVAVRRPRVPYLALLRRPQGVRGTCGRRLGPFLRVVDGMQRAVGLYRPVRHGRHQEDRLHRPVAVDLQPT